MTDAETLKTNTEENCVEDDKPLAAEVALKALNKTSPARSTAEQIDQQSKLLKRNIKVAGAPKMPLSGYVRFLHERREQLRREQPQRPALEYMKIISEEWQAMSDDIKEPYLQAAALEKQKYLGEINKFFEDHPDILAKELAKDSQTRGNGRKGKARNDKSHAGESPTKKDKSDKRLNKTLPAPQAKSKREPEVVQQTPSARANDKKIVARNTSPILNNTNVSLTVPTVLATSVNKVTTGEIPIFTNEFLEHNKIFDNELRTLRKQKTDFEQQNAVLERHVENTTVGLEKVEKENSEREDQNRLLEEYLTQLEQKLVNAFAGLAIPNISSGDATLENIHEYMAELYKMATANTHAPGLNKARDIMRKLDLQITTK